ncbi:MAG: flippase-like domain-containing protein [bacterium]|nr:flippase-like domain-containing protein [bacterium]
MKFIKFIISFAITGFFSYIVFKDLNFIKLKAAIIESKPYIWLPIAVVIYYFAFLLRSLRWKIILKIKISAIKFAPYTLIGFFLNAVLPFRAGEPARAIIVAKNFKINITKAITTVVIERWFDIMYFIIIGVIFTSKFIGSNLIILLPPIFLIVTFIMLKKIKFNYNGSNKVIKKLHTIINFINDTISDIDLKKSIYIGLLTIAIWLIEALNFIIISRFFSIMLGVKDTLIIMFFLATGAALPQAPGYIGTFEAFGVFAFKLLNISTGKELDFLIALHAFQLAFIIITGGISFIKIIK